MQILEVKINELEGFVGSDQYQSFHPKPITPERAISQSRNPAAKAEDTALLVAHDGPEVIGFAGLLPVETNQQGVRFFSNSCWWAHPEKGRGVALPLLLSLFKKADSRFYLTDATPHTKSILEKTGVFEFPAEHAGVRGILRFYLSDLFEKKYPWTCNLNWLLKAVDWLLNTAREPLRFVYLKRLIPDKMSIQKVDKIDPDVSQFILKHSASEFIKKSPEYLEWIKQYPWVTESKEVRELDYPFSYHIKKYRLEYLVLKNEGKIIAFLAFSLRDNLVKIPLVYYEPDREQEVMKWIAWYVLKQRFDSVVTFHEPIVKFFESRRMIFLHRKRVAKIVGYSKSLTNIEGGKIIFQDGDGDYIFT